MAAYMERFGLQRAPELRPYDSAIMGGKAMPFGHPMRTDLPDALRGLVRTNLFGVDLRRQYFQPYWQHLLAQHQGRTEQAMTALRSRSVHDCLTALRASSVVLAVPVPALRHIAFEPPLSPEKTAALAAISYAEVLKVQCAFAERFWEGQGWHGNLATDLPLRVWHATESQPGAGGILTCSLVGAPTRLARQLSHEALFETLWRELAPALGGWQGTPERVIATDWVGDAFAGGGWMVDPVPSQDGLRTLLGQPHGRCLFAGEHLDAEYGAHMEGALRSGREEARQLLAMLASGDACPRPQ
jgi:monoamine oxidase